MIRVLLYRFPSVSMVFYHHRDIPLGFLWKRFLFDFQLWL